MRFFAYHGVTPAEQELGQTFVVDVELGVDLREAGESDKLDDTIDYRGVHKAVRELVTGSRFGLIEALAEELAGRLIKQSRVVECLVRITKPHPLLPGDLEYAAVEVLRRKAP